MDTNAQIKPLTPAARSALTAAGHLFYEQGVNAVGVDTIAAQAGVTKKTLYDQFGSKAALVTAYLSERDRHYRTWIEREIEGLDPASGVLAIRSW